MKTNKEEEGDDAEDVLGEIYGEPPRHSLVEKAGFQAWHHPRKHWVRINQLCRLAQRLIQESHLIDGTLRCLTLPGEDLLDLQSLEGYEELLDVQSLQGAIHRGSARMLKYLGFNSVSTSEEKRSMQTYVESVLADKDTIAKDSEILNCQIQDIANRASFAYKKVETNGPFNIINLDLCGSVANKAPGSSRETYFDAIAAIIELQRRNTTQPFMLHIATRSGNGEVDLECLDLIAGTHRSNIDNSAEYRVAFESIMEREAMDLIETILRGGSVSQEVLNAVFGVGIGKWLLQLVRGAQPYWDVSLEHLCCYSVSGGVPNMLTLAFKFSLVQEGMVDKIGLARGLSGRTPVPEESELAIRMLKKSEEIVNVDSLLSDDEAARHRVIKQSAKLLAGIGYSENAYLEWAGSLYPPA